MGCYHRGQDASQIDTSKKKSRHRYSNKFVERSALTPAPINTCPRMTNCPALHTALYLAEVENVVDDVEEHLG
jgi:hypothetical protein